MVTRFIICYYGKIHVAMTDMFEGATPGCHNDMNSLLLVIDFVLACIINCGGIPSVFMISHCFAFSMATKISNQIKYFCSSSDFRVANTANISETHSHTPYHYIQYT